MQGMVPVCLTVVKQVSLRAMSGDADTSNITVRLFGAFREAAGAGEIRVDLPGNSTVRELLELIADRGDALADIVEPDDASVRYAVALNHQYVSPETGVPVGAEVALIPPVSGG